MFLINIASGSVANIIAPRLVNVVCECPLGSYLCSCYGAVKVNELSLLLTKLLTHNQTKHKS